MSNFLFHRETANQTEDDAAASCQIRGHWKKRTSQLKNKPLKILFTLLYQSWYSQVYAKIIEYYICQSVVTNIFSSIFNKLPNIPIFDQYSSIDLCVLSIDVTLVEKIHAQHKNQ